MIDHDEKQRLIEALARTFTRAIGEAQKLLIASHSPIISKEVTPQVCSLLLCTGAIVSGMVLTPISYDNLDAPDAVQMAAQTLKDTLKNIPGLKSDFKIVAVAMTTTLDHKSGQLVDVDLNLYEQSLSELPNLIAPYVILVDPDTKTTAYSEPFSNFRIVS